MSVRAGIRGQLKRELTAPVDIAVFIIAVAIIAVVRSAGVCGGEW